MRRDAIQVALSCQHWEAGATDIHKRPLSFRAKRSAVEKSLAVEIIVRDVSASVDMTIVDLVGRLATSLR